LGGYGEIVKMKSKRLNLGHFWPKWLENGTKSG
jgi:hypothetical protein